MIRLAQGEPVRNSVSPFNKKPQCEIHLRVEGVSQDDNLQDEAQMKEIDKKLGKLRFWIMYKIPS